MVAAFLRAGGMQSGGRQNWTMPNWKPPERCGGSTATKSVSRRMSRWPVNSTPMRSPRLKRPTTWPEKTSYWIIGPVTAAAYAEEIGRAKTILWNGPMGVAEWETVQPRNNYGRECGIVQFRGRFGCRRRFHGGK